MPTSAKYSSGLKHIFAIQHSRQWQIASRNLKNDKRFLTPFITLLLLYCGWTLSLPVFPTQDGPMHLYYVNVIHHLLSGNSIFNDFYSIRTPLPPYTIQYLFLLGLTQVLHPVVAEKCMVCIILISIAFGFRFLATGIGKNGKLMSLWIFPLALGWPLFMGFHNFCLSLSFTLWALGIWFRAVHTMRPFHRAAFIFAVAIVTLTHPVPLVFLLAVISADTCVRLMGKGLKQNLPWKKAMADLRWNIALVFLAYCSLGYVSLFLNKANADVQLAPHKSHFAVFKELVSLEPMCFASGGISTKIYRFALYGLLLFSFTLAMRKLRSNSVSSRLNSSITLFITSLALLAAIPMMPSRMNGFDNFAERLPILIWLTAIAAASTNNKLSSRFQTAIAVCAYLLAGFNLCMADRLIRPIANDIARIENAPLHRYKAGLILPASKKLQPARVSFDPYYLWNGSRYFRQAGILLLNDPWAGPPNILPINRHSNPVIARFSQSELMHPEALYNRLLTSEADRKDLLAKVDFIMFVGLPTTGNVPDPLLTLDSSRSWICEQNLWYFSCSSDRDHSNPTKTSPLSIEQVETRTDQFNTFKITDRVNTVARR